MPLLSLSALSLPSALSNGEHWCWLRAQVELRLVSAHVCVLLTWYNNSKDTNQLHCLHFSFVVRLVLPADHHRGNEVNHEVNVRNSLQNSLNSIEKQVQDTKKVRITL